MIIKFICRSKDCPKKSFYMTVCRDFRTEEASIRFQLLKLECFKQCKITVCRSWTNSAWMDVIIRKTNSAIVYQTYIMTNLK